MLILKILILLCSRSLLNVLATPSVFLLSSDNICLEDNVTYKCSVGTVGFDIIAVIINGSAYNEVQLVNTFNNQITFVAGNSGTDGAGNFIDVHANITVSNISTIYNNTEIGCLYLVNTSIAASLIFTLPVPPATAPNITNATAMGAVCGVKVDWTVPYSESPITGYTLYQNSTVIYSTTIATSYSTSQLTSGETYNYTVLASTCVDSSPVSQGVLFTTPKDAGISATNCTALYAAMSDVFTLVFTQPLQNYPISYIINISSANSTQLFTTNSTILPKPSFTINVTLDTTYNYTASITAVLHCPSASNITCSTDVTIIPITTTTTASTTTTTTAPATTTYSASSVTNTNIGSTSDFPITNSMDTANTNSILSGSSTTSMQTDTYISTSNATTNSFPVHILFPLTIVLLIVWMLLMVIVCTFISCFLLSRIRFVKE